MHRKRATVTAALVVNSGSSSFKYQLIEMTTEETLASGLVERIGEETGRARHSHDGDTVEFETPIPDHTAGFDAMIRAFAEHGPSLDEFPPIAVGHRVVHGGKRFYEPTVVTDLVKINIEDLSDLAPLHNPANLEGIEAAQKGVRLNTDAIDNSAGVNTSDVEVNIKIALTTPERDGRLTQDQRNALLADMTEDVAALVLRNSTIAATASHAGA